MTATPQPTVAHNAAKAVTELSAFTAINDDMGLHSADQLLAFAKQTLSAIDKALDDDISFAHNEHKRLIAEKKKIYDPVEREAKRIKRLMADYKDKLEREARAERLRLEAEAREREAERKLSEAIAAEAAGDTVQADQILAEPITVAPAYIQPPPKAEARFRTIYKFEVTDPALVPRELCKPDEVKIRGLVNSLKDNAKIPGVRVWSEKV